jgi:broad specificity phosphatase PhoE
MEEPTRVRFPGGEGFDDLRARACAALAELRAEHDGETIAVVTHGGVIRAALAEALGLATERIFALDVGYCRVSVVDWFGDDAVVRLVNGTGADVPPVPLVHAP